MNIGNRGTLGLDADVKTNLPCPFAFLLLARLGQEPGFQTALPASEGPVERAPVLAGLTSGGRGGYAEAGPRLRHEA
jgi:hypothetical protein